MGNRLYDRSLSLVTDPTEYDGVYQMKRKKYPKQKIPPGARFMIFHVMDH